MGFKNIYIQSSTYAPIFDLRTATFNKTVGSVVHCNVPLIPHQQRGATRAICTASVTPLWFKQALLLTRDQFENIVLHSIYTL